MQARELTPRALAECVAPGWRIDGTVLGGAWRLVDVYAAKPNERIVVELHDGRAALSIAVELDRGGASSETAAGLAISWLAPGPSDAGSAACRELAALLRAAGPEWTSPKSTRQRLVEALEQEVRTLPSRVDEDPDRVLLAKDQAQYAWLYGAEPRAVRVVCAGEPVRGVSIHYPRPSTGAQPPSGQLYPAPSRFRRRRFRLHFARLGCVLDDDDMPRTVPTPSTFTRATNGRGGTPPLSPRLIRGTRRSISARAWVTQVVREGVLPVQVAPRWAVTLHRAARWLGPLSEIPVDVGMLAHDVSLHALGLHAVDATAWETLRRRADERLVRGGRATARRVAAFFEGTVTREAWNVWNEIDAPEDFATRFAQRVDALSAELARC